MGGGWGVGCGGYGVREQIVTALPPSLSLCVYGALGFPFSADISLFLFLPLTISADTFVVCV